MGTLSIYSGFQQVTRYPTIFPKRIDDAYKIKGKLREPTVCPQCSAAFQKGRWQWLSPPSKNAHSYHCPACQRILDHYPAGYLTLEGDFFEAHRDEILHLVQNLERREKSEHVTTPHRHGETKRQLADHDHGYPSGTRYGRSYTQLPGGNLKFHYNHDENLLRVHWAR